MNTSKETSKDISIEQTHAPAHKRKFADPSPARTLVKNLNTILNMAGK